MKRRPGRLVLCYFRLVWHKTGGWECVHRTRAATQRRLMRRSERKTLGSGQWRKQQLPLRQGHSAFHLGRRHHFCLIWPPSPSTWHVSSCRTERNHKRKFWESNSSHLVFEGFNALNEQDLSCGHVFLSASCKLATINGLLFVLAFFKRKKCPQLCFTSCLRKMTIKKKENLFLLPKSSPVKKKKTGLFLLVVVFLKQVFSSLN